MKMSVRELVAQSLEALTACVAAGGGDKGKDGGTGVALKEWAQDWPCQVRKMIRMLLVGITVLV